MTIRPLDPYQTLVEANEKGRSELKNIHVQNEMQMLQAAFLMGERCRSLKDRAVVLFVENKRLTTEISLLKSTFEAEWQATSDNMHAKIEPIYSKVEAIKSYFDRLIVKNFDEREKLAKECNQRNQFAEEGRVWGRFMLAQRYSSYFSEVMSALKKSEELSTMLPLKMKNLKFPPLIPIEKVEEQQIVSATNPNDFFALAAKQKESLKYQNSQASMHNESLVKQISFLKDSHRELSKDKALVFEKLVELVSQSQKI